MHMVACSTYIYTHRHTHRFFHALIPVKLVFIFSEVLSISESSLQGACPHPVAKSAGWSQAAITHTHSNCGVETDIDFMPTKCI